MTTVQVISVVQC